MGTNSLTDQDRGSSPPVDSLADIAVECWRFAKVVNRLIDKVDAGEQSRYESQLRWFLKRIGEAFEKCNLHVVSVEGQPFEPGMAVTPVNLTEFGPQDNLIVDKMLEPIIMSETGLVKTGSVTLRKGNI